MNLNISNIVWGFDGTLFDTYSAIVDAFMSVFSTEYDIEIDRKRVYNLVKIDTKYCAAIISQEHGFNEKNLLLKARKAYDNQQDIEQLPFENVAKVCDYIQSNGGSNYLVTHRDKVSLEKMLLAYGFQQYFEEIITADDAFALKPSPESFLYLVTKHNLNPTQTFAVGDRDIDLLAADAAGLSSIYFSELGYNNPIATINITTYSELLTKLGVYSITN